MLYEFNKVKNNKKAFIEWVENLAGDLQGVPEDKNAHAIFPASADGDVTTIKDLVGNFLAVLKEQDVEVK